MKTSAALVAATIAGVASALPYKNVHGEKIARASNGTTNGTNSAVWTDLRGKVCFSVSIRPWSDIVDMLSRSSTSSI